MSLVEIEKDFNKEVDNIEYFQENYSIEFYAYKKNKIY